MNSHYLGGGFLEGDWEVGQPWWTFDSKCNFASVIVSYSWVVSNSLQMCAVIAACKLLYKWSSSLTAATYSKKSLRG